MQLKTIWVLAIALALLGVPGAFGTTQLTLQSGATLIVIQDGGVGDFNPAAGAITYIGSVGTWDLNVTTGLNQEVYPGGTPAGLDLNSQNTCSGPLCDSLTMLFSANNLAYPAPSGFATGIGGTLDAGQTLSYQAWLDNGNVLGGTASPLNPVYNAAGPGPFSSALYSSVVPGVPLYALTQQVVLTGAGTASFNADIDINPVPEPASVALLGGVLVVAFGAVRRKLRKA